VECRMRRCVRLRQRPAYSGSADRRKAGLLRAGMNLFRSEGILSLVPVRSRLRDESKTSIFWADRFDMVEGPQPGGLFLPVC
jgi:hypothetical protein